MRGTKRAADTDNSSDDDEDEDKVHTMQRDKPKAINEMRLPQAAAADDLQQMAGCSETGSTRASVSQQLGLGLAWLTNATCCRHTKACHKAHKSCNSSRMYAELIKY